MNFLQLLRKYQKDEDNLKWLGIYADHLEDMDKGSVALICRKAANFKVLKKRDKLYLSVFLASPNHHASRCPVCDEWVHPIPVSGGCCYQCFRLVCTEKIEKDG